MSTIMPAVERDRMLRREVNALQGLVHFSQARQYPAEIVHSLRKMLVGRERILQQCCEAEASGNV